MGGGNIHGTRPEAWAGDGPGDVKRSGQGTPPPSGTDVDYIKVEGKWYKIRGPVFILKNGTIIGIHFDATENQINFLKKEYSELFEPMCD